MDKKKRFLIIALISVLIFGIAIFAYNALSKDYNFAENGADSSQSSTEEESASPESSKEELLPAPDFTVYTENGDPVKLSDFKGKPVVINFWATWCGYCKMEMPAFDKVAAEYADKVVFMMINVTDGDGETVEKASAYIKDEGYTFPVYYDTDLSATMVYGAYSLPSTGFITASGNFAGGQMGAMSEEALRSYIEQLIEIE